MRSTGNTYYPTVEIPQYDPIMTDNPEEFTRQSGINRPMEVISDPSTEPDTGTGRSSRTGSSRTAQPPPAPITVTEESSAPAPRETGRGTFTNRNRPVSLDGSGSPPYDLDRFVQENVTGVRRVRSDARDTSGTLNAPRSTGLSSGTTNTAARDWRREAIQTGRNPDTGEPIIPRTLDDTGRSPYVPPDPFDPLDPLDPNNPNNPANPPGTGGGGFYYPGSGGGGTPGGISINSGGGGQSGGGYVGTTAGAFAELGAAFGGWLPVVMVGIVISILWYND